MDVVIATSPDLRSDGSSTDMLDDAALLRAILGGRRSRASRRLLEGHGGLAGLCRAGQQELARTGCLSPIEARRLCAALELGRRAAVATLTHVPHVIDSFEAVCRWAQPRLAGLDHEEVWLLTLDGRNGLRAARRIARGGLHGCALSPKDVLAPALRDAASAIILVHNHPSGAADPSPEDIAMTETLAMACDVVGITLLDHIVVARSGVASILDPGA